MVVLKVAWMSGSVWGGMGSAMATGAMESSFHCWRLERSLACLRMAAEVRLRVMRASQAGNLAGLRRVAIGLEEGVLGDILREHGIADA